jgi:Tol biopolymer transport system component
VEGKAARLTTGLGAHSIAVAHDRRTLVYSALAQTANVWSVPIPAVGEVGTAAARLTTGGAQFVEGIDVSADGRWLVFDTDRGGNQDIFRVPLQDGVATAEPEPLVENDGDDVRPSLSPDGRDVAYYGFRQGVRRAFLVASNGGVPYPLAQRDSGEQHSPLWSPDGRHITFHRTLGGIEQIFDMARVGGSSWSSPRQLTRQGGWGGRWSPDGTRIAYLAPRQLRVLRADAGDDAHAVVLFDAADAATGHATPVAARWAADGRTLYVKAFDPAGMAAIWAVPVDGGAARRVLRFDEPQRPTRRPEFTTDGRHLYFTLVQSESDLWAVRLEGP